MSAKRTMAAVGLLALVVPVFIVPAAASSDPVVVSASVLASGEAPTPTPTAQRPGMPDSIAVLGDSISAGTGTSGLPGSEQKANSWATGTNSTVNSLYLRLRAVNPAIDGKNYNIATNGADMTDAPGQANQVPLDTEYVVIQMGGNDLCKSTLGQMATPSAYRTNFRTTLANLAARVPNALVGVSSVPDIYNLWYIRGAPNPPNPNTSSNAGAARLFWSGFGGIAEFPCQSLLANATNMSTTDQNRREAVRARNIELNQVLAEECAKVLRCRFDDFEMFNFTSNRVWNEPGQAPSSAPLLPANQFRFVDGDISTIDHFHPSLAGHVKVAAESWRLGYQFADDTPPQITATLDRSQEASGSVRITAVATDDAGVRGLAHRWHPVEVPASGQPQLGTPTSWTEVVTDQVTLDRPRLTPGFVEVRAMDRNGNLSAGQMVEVFPSPAGSRAVQAFQRISTINGVPNTNSVRVTWQSPDDADRQLVAPLLAYEVTAQPGNLRCRVESTADSFNGAYVAPAPGCNFTGLVPGQPYSFEVVAITQAGPGPAVAANNGDPLVFVGEPGPVVDPSAAPVAGGISASWQPPLNNGGAPISSYTVTAVPVGGGTTRTCTTASVSCTVPLVVAGTTYNLTVRATNAAAPPSTFTFSSVTAIGPVTMARAPVAPAPPDAEVDGASVTVSWPAIPGDQLTPSATVTVTASPGGATCAVPATATSCTIADLTMLTSYSFMVMVDNGVGTAEAVVSALVARSPESVVPFADVTAPWAIAPTRWLLANDITTGVGNPADNLFGPSGQVTRAQMAAFLWRLAAKPEPPANWPTCFTDVVVPNPDRPPFFAKGACWLKEQGITTNNAYNPAGNVTRGQMAAFLWRLAGRPDAPASCGLLDAPTNIDFRTGACWLKANNLTSATTQFNFADPVTRAQMAKFLYDFANR
jgi:lysophospholipase L1-like esterase